MSLDAESPLERAFDKACRLTGGALQDHLDALQDQDAELSRELRRLLEVHAEAARQFDRPPSLAELAPAVAEPSIAALKVDGFEIMESVGSGSFGMVFRARQIAPDRDVALKILRATLSEDVSARFRREAALLAKLSHPGIAALHAVGTCEVAGGKPIVAYARDHGFDQRARLELVFALCEAVHHGHERQIIHRDLKPANVLVSEEGILKVIDFAVARTLDAEASVDLTRTGGVIGSLSYMSPEQARGSLDSVDHRTDVYAIGVVLFELIAGRCPHALEGRSWFESLRIVSTRPMPGLSLHAPRAARDLEAIVSLATAFEPSRRYASLAALAQDLRSFLRGETVMARLPTPAYLLRKGLKRHRVLVVSAAIILLLSLVAPVVSWNLYLRSEQRGELAERRARDLRRQVYLTHLAIAQQTILDGEIHVARTHLGSCPEELRHWEWRHLYRRCHRPARLLVAEKGRRSDLAFLSPSSVLASGAADAFTLWDLDAASPVRRYAGAKGFVDAFAVHDAARQIAAVDRSGFFCLWNFEGELLHTEPGSYLGAPAFGAEGRTCYLTDR